MSDEHHRTRQSSPIFKAVDRSLAPIVKQLDSISAKLDAIAATVSRAQLEIALIRDRLQRLEDEAIKTRAELDKLMHQRSWLLGAAAVVGAIASWLAKKFGG